MIRPRMPLVVTMSNYGFLERFPANVQIGWNPPSILVDVILDRHSRLKTSDLQARLKALDLPGGTFTPEQVVEFVDLMQVYEGAMYEISTKLEILDDEVQVRFSHDPIHHMERRLKSVSSIIGKLERKGLPIGVNSIKDNLFDVAGIRVICNYRDDVYSVANYLSSQSDIQVLRVKDYIKNPKQNGYRSLHVIYAVPVFLSSGAHYTPVEVYTLLPAGQTAVQPSISRPVKVLSQLPSAVSTASAQGASADRPNSFCCIFSPARRAMLRSRVRSAFFSSQLLRAQR